MSNLNLVSARTVDSPPTGALCEYLVAGNGLFVRAEDARLEACIPVAAAVCPGLADLIPCARLKLGRIHPAYLTSIYQSAVRRLPNEAAYQFLLDASDPVPWRVAMPAQLATPTGVDYTDDPLAVVDLHSHGALPAFWSATDDSDECGLRFYVVVGHVGTDAPTIFCRVGVYGHRWNVPALSIFEALGPFTDVFDKEAA
jgi:PRTRC genetic system protein A